MRTKQIAITAIICLIVCTGQVLAESVGTGVTVVPSATPMVSPTPTNIPVTVTPTPTVTSGPVKTVTPTPVKVSNPSGTPTPTPENVGTMLIEDLSITYGYDGHAYLEISGVDFTDGSVVTIDGVVYEVNSRTSTILRVLLPDGFAGEFSVKVTNPDGSSATKIYTSPNGSVTPTVTPTSVVSSTQVQIFSVNPDGNNLIVTGENFESGMTGSINGRDYSLNFIDNKNAEFAGAGNLSGSVTIKITTENYGSTEKTVTLKSKAFTLDILAITGAVQDAAATPAVQVETVAATGTVTAVAVTSVFEYIKIAFIPWRKRKKYWGMVLDANNAKPVPLAVINLLDFTSGKIVASTVSDMNGRYGLVADPGKYTMTVNHFEYKLSTRPAADVFYGQGFNISSESGLTLDIYMTKTGEGKAPLGYRLKMAWDRFLKIFTAVYPYLLTIFLATNVYFMVVTWQSVYVFLSIYHVALFVFFFAVLGKYMKQWAVCIDSVNGSPVAHAMVKLYKINENELVDTQIADDKGRFQFIVPKEKYQLIASAAGYSFPSKRNKIWQDNQGKMVVDFNSLSANNYIPLDRAMGTAPAGTGASRFGTIN